MVLRQEPYKDRKSPSAVPVTSNEQDLPGVPGLQAFSDPPGFSTRGIFLETTNAHLCGHLFGFLPDISFGVLGWCSAEEMRVGRGVDKKMLAIAGAQKLHAATEAIVLAVASEYDNYVRLFRAITYQEAASEAGENQKENQQCQQKDKFPGTQEKAMRAPRDDDVLGLGAD